MDWTSFWQLAEEFGVPTAILISIGYLYHKWTQKQLTKLEQENKDLKKRITDLGTKYEASLKEEAQKKELLYERMIEMFKNN